MFHLYFGAFDLVLYASGFYVAMVFAKVLSPETKTATPVQLDEQISVSTPALQPAATGLDLSQILETEVLAKHELMLDAMTSSELNR